MKSLNEHILEKLYLTQVQRNKYYQQVNEKLIINKDYVNTSLDLESWKYMLSIKFYCTDDLWEEKMHVGLPTPFDIKYNEDTVLFSERLTLANAVDKSQREFIIYNSSIIYYYNVFMRSDNKKAHAFQLYINPFIYYDNIMKMLHNFIVYTSFTMNYIFRNIGISDEFLEIKNDINKNNLNANNIFRAAFPLSTSKRTIERIIELLKDEKSK